MNDNIDEMPCEKLPRNTTKIMYPDQGDSPTSFGPKLFARKYQIRDIAILTYLDSFVLKSNISVIMKGWVIQTIEIAF